MATRLGELMLHLDVTGSPRWAGSFSPKQFGGPGELEASLGELGSRKLHENTLLPPPFWYFFASLTKTSNDISSCAVTGVEQHSSAS